MTRAFIFRFLKKYSTTLSLFLLGFLVLGFALFVDESFFNSSDKEEVQDSRLSQLEKLKTQSIDWVLKDRTGETFHLSSYRNKKSITINLWASWCAPCIKELPELSLLAKKTHSHNIVFAITTESPDKVKRFLEESFSDLDPHFKIVVLTEKEQQKHFTSDALPVTYLFNKKGYLDNKIIGAKNWVSSSWIRYIKNL